jgi:enoyl-CoA hydratase/carnithine racemase
MTNTTLLFSLEGPVATITLNRPEKLNAMDPPMLTQLEQVCQDLERDTTVRVVLLTGAGTRAFSAGADIIAWSSLQPLEMWRSWIRNGHRVFERVARLPQPVIAVLNGVAFGGGFELALAADLRIAAEHTQLALPETGIGTVPGWGGTQRLPALIGAARAKEMIFTGRRVDAATAERWGLVNAVEPGTNVMGYAVNLAQEIAARAPLSVQMAKQLVDSAQGDAQTMTLEALAGALASSTEDGHEGVAAFRERRQPRFTGS